MQVLWQVWKIVLADASIPPTSRLRFASAAEVFPSLSRKSRRPNAANLYLRMKKKKMLKLLRTKPPAGIFERAEQQIFHSPVNLRSRFPVWTAGRLTEQRVHSKRAKRAENKKHVKMELKIKGLHDRLYYILDDSQSIRSNPVSQPPQNCTPEPRVNHNMISLFPIDTKTKDKDAFFYLIGSPVFCSSRALSICSE